MPDMHSQTDVIFKTSKNCSNSIAVVLRSANIRKFSADTFGEMLQEFSMNVPLEIQCDENIRVLNKGFLLHIQGLGHIMLKCSKTYDHA